MDKDLENGKYDTLIKGLDEKFSTETSVHLR